MKAMDKDRSRRYETAAEFVTDINRHLDNEPVVAAAPSTGYRLRKFVRRNRVVVVAGLLIVMALALGAVFTTVGMLEARKQRNRAVENFEKVKQLAFELLGASFQISNIPMPPEEDAKILRKAMVEQTLHLYEDILKENANDLQLRYNVSQLYNLLGETQAVLEKDYAEAVKLVSKACAGYEQLLQEQPDNPDYRRELAFTKSTLAFGFMYLNQPQKAKSAHQEGIKTWEPLNIGFYFGQVKNMETGINSTSSDLWPSLTQDRLTIVLSSQRKGGEGSMDLWIAKRNSTSEPFGEPEDTASKSRCPSPVVPNPTTAVPAGNSLSPDPSRSLSTVYE